MFFFILNVQFQILTRDVVIFFFCIFSAIAFS